MNDRIRGNFAGAAIGLAVAIASGHFDCSAADPVLTNRQPEPDATDISPRIPITFTIVDHGEGVNTRLFLNGIPVTRGQAIRAPDQVDYTFLPDLDRQFATNLVRVEFSSLVGTGTMYTNAWAFTTRVDPNFVGPSLTVVQTDVATGEIILTWPLEAFEIGYVPEVSNSATGLAWSVVGGVTTNSITFRFEGDSSYLRLNSYPTSEPVVR